MLGNIKKKNMICNFNRQTNLKSETQNYMFIFVNISIVFRCSKIAFILV